VDVDEAGHQQETAALEYLSPGAAVSVPPGAISAICPSAKRTSTSVR
jgi:hypothetical protein